MGCGGSKDSKDPELAKSNKQENPIVSAGLCLVAFFALQFRQTVARSQAGACKGSQPSSCLGAQDGN